VIRLEGVGLHGGAEAALIVSTTKGPTTLGHRGARAALRSLVIEGRDRTTVARFPDGSEVRSVEHVLAAIGGLGAFSGIHVEIEGDEAPLLDGASRAVADVIDAIDSVARDAFTDRAVVARAETIEVEGATYRFEPATSVEEISIEVEIDFPAERFGRPLAGRASWHGDRTVFLDEIATARTFGAARELEALRARGLAAHVPEGAVVAIDLDDPIRAPRDPGEPARHKLLDLIGDLAALGAPLRGRLHVHRPSHRASYQALARARSIGVLT
jgi:UDP-3-O-acyl-N-acetylglucosamine deacetylase